MFDFPLSTVLEHNYCLHHELSWHPHINYIYSKASQLFVFLKRALHTELFAQTTVASIY